MAMTEKTLNTGVPAQPGMPLAFAQQGEDVVVSKVRGKDDTRRFLESLGFVEGHHVSIVTSMGGNVIVLVKDTRVAISRAMAAQIMVTPVR